MFLFLGILLLYFFLNLFLFFKIPQPVLDQSCFTECQHATSQLFELQNHRQWKAVVVGYLFGWSISSRSCSLHATIHQLALWGMVCLSAEGFLFIAADGSRMFCNLLFLSVFFSVYHLFALALFHPLSKFHFLSKFLFGSQVSRR